MTAADADGGWSFVAEHEAAPKVIEALLDLDSEETYTKTDLADAADVPLKTLYLDGTLDAFADAGFLERVDADEDGEAETEYALAGDGPLAAAQDFDDAL